MTALTAQQLANTTTDAFDVEHRYFAAGVKYDTLTLAAYQAQPPTGWTVSGNTITPPPGWTEISDRVIWEGDFIEQWQDEKQTWQCSLQGQDFDRALLDRNMALAGWVRYTNGAWSSGWQLEWLGAITKYGWRDDFTTGQPWNLTVGGTETQIDRQDAPRIVTGALNMLEGANLDPSETLATAAAEVNNGEFVGTTANVEAENMLDGRLATGWIAANAPTITGEATVAAKKLNEVFFSPVAGYNTSAVWWFEWWNNTDQPTGDRALHAFLAYTTQGKIAVVRLPSGTIVRPGEFVIVCRNRGQAETYAGSFQNAAQVFETDALGSQGFVEIYTVSDGAGHTGDAIRRDGQYCQFDLNPAGGWLFWWEEGGFLPGGAFQDAVKWGANVAGPQGSNWNQWTGAPVALPATGLSLRRSPGCGDTGAAADWVAGIPTPGHYFSANNSQWVKVELREHVSTLKIGCAAGAGTLQINEGTVGWPLRGQGVIEGDVFDYTGRTAGTLTGCSGLLAHAEGALAYPYAGGQAQTGWRLAAVRVRRPPGLPYIKQLRAWFSPNAGGRNYNEANFWLDYQAPFYTIGNGTSSGPNSARATADVTIPLAGEWGAGRWVRSFIVALDAMWGDGRAKINELAADGVDVYIGDDFAAAIDTNKAAALAAYLLDQYTWLTAADFQDNTGDGWGLIGEVATAVAPVPDVIGDLAKGHGCVCRFAPTGRVSFERNPWWPGGVSYEDPPFYLYLVTEADVRGELKVSAERNSLTGVAVLAKTPTGEVLPRQVYPPSANGSQVREINDVVCKDEKTALDLAFYAYLKLAAEARAEFTLRGIGEWASPRQRLQINWRGDDLGQWIIERVMRRWRMVDGQKQFETWVEARSFLGMP